MNARYRRVPARFAPDIRFELQPTAPGLFRRTQETELERLKNRLVREKLQDLNPLENSGVRRAANEAEALAWITPYPLLVFPTLFDEKTADFRRVARRQEIVREQTRELLAI